MCSRGVNRFGYVAHGGVFRGSCPGYGWGKSPTVGKEGTCRFPYDSEWPGEF